MPASTWKNRNIFEGVLRLEDSLTDALRNFLKYQSVRDALWRTLPENVRESVDFSLIEDTQTRSSGGHSEGIPDLVLYGFDFILVIEVKIGAGLTDEHQQNAYVPWIKKECRDSQKEMGFVVFLTPDDYPRDELKPCIEQGRRLCRSNNSNIQVHDPIAITWQKFVTEFEAQDMRSLNELIREFYDHLSERFIPKPVIFSTEEVRLMHTRETASGILKLMNIVGKVKDNLDLDSSKVTGPHRGDGYAYNFFSSEKVYFHFGIWWQFWAEHGLPLCVAIKNENNQSIQAFRKQYGTRVLLFEKWLVFGYNLPEPGTDCSELIDEIGKDIEALLRYDVSESSEDAETP